MLQRTWLASAFLPTLLLFLLFTCHPASACSTFLYGDADSGVFVARNYDWSCGEGLAVINKRGVKKRAVSFDNPASWESEYGSVSFCQYGREFPCDGMNEAGLMVSVLWLAESKYPHPDKRPSVSTLQWVQYQLDTAKSVAEVVESNAHVRVTSIAGSAVHYFICDKSGDCATIEWLDGKRVVHRGEQLAHRCLTNSTCAVSQKTAARLSDFGGTISPGESEASLDRYCRAAVAARKENWPATLYADYGFEVLSDLGRTDFTKWRVVYDLKTSTLHFRTNAYPKSKQIHLADFDLGTVTPVLVFDMNSAGAGDIREKFAPYSESQNRQILTTALRETGVLRGVPNAKQLIEIVVAYPESCHPVAPVASAP